VKSEESEEFHDCYDSFEQLDEDDKHKCAFCTDAATCQYTSGDNKINCCDDCKADQFEVDNEEDEDEDDEWEEEENQTGMLYNLSINVGDNGKFCC